jgi:hypothetical protein
MSSEMFPFASHAKYGYDLGFADAELKVMQFHLSTPLMLKRDKCRRRETWLSDMDIDLRCILDKFVPTLQTNISALTKNYCDSLHN